MILYLFRAPAQEKGCDGSGSGWDVPSAFLIRFVCRGWREGVAPAINTPGGNSRGE